MSHTVFTHRAPGIFFALSLFIGLGFADAAVPLKPVRQFEADGGGVNSIAVSPDGKYVAAGNTDGTTWMWEIATGKALWHAKWENFEALSVAFSKDGTRLLTADGGGMMRIVDAKTGEVKVTFHQENQAAIERALFFGDDKYVVSTGVNREIRTWDASTGKQLMALAGHKNWVGQLVVLPSSSGKSLALSGGMDKTVRLWDLTAGKEIAHAQFGGGVTAMALSPDGSRLYCAITSRVIRVLNPLTCKTIKVLKDPRGLGTMCLAVSPDGKSLLMGNYKNQARLLDATTGKILINLHGHRDTVWNAAFSPDGRFALTAGGGTNKPNGKIGKDDAIRLWNLHE